MNLFVERKNFIKSSADMGINSAASMRASEKIFAIALVTLATAAAIKIYSKNAKRDNDWYSSLSENVFIVGAVLIGASVITETYHKYNELRTQNSELRTQNSELSTQNNELSTQNNELSTQNSELSTQNNELSTQNNELSTQNNELSTQNNELSTQNNELRTQNNELNTENSLKRTENNYLSFENSGLKEKIQELEISQAPNLEVIMPEPLYVSYPTSDGSNTFVVSTNDMQYPKIVKQTAKIWKERISQICTMDPKEILSKFNESYSEKIWLQSKESYFYFPLRGQATLPIISFSDLQDTYTIKDKETDVFWSLSNLLEGVSYYSHRIKQLTNRQSLRIILAKNNDNVEGMAVFDTVRGHVELLTSNPNNIPHAKNKERIKGSGTSIVLYLALWALQNEKDIILDPIESARPFYQRLHFQDDGFGRIRLTVKKIKALIEKDVFPFSLLKSETAKMVFSPLEPMVNYKGILAFFSIAIIASLVIHSRKKAKNKVDEKD